MISRKFHNLLVHLGGIFIHISMSKSQIILHFIIYYFSILVLNIRKIL